MDSPDPTDGQSLTVTLLIGVGLTIIGGFVDNLGVTAMKLSHRALQQQEALGAKAERFERPSAYWMTKKWMFGFFLFGIGNILNVVGLSYAPQSLFAALGALTLVWNALNSSIILGEKLTRRIIFGTSLIFAGSCLAVLFGSTVEENFSLDDLASQALSPLFLAYGSIIIAIICLTQMSIHVLEKRLYRAESLAEPDGKVNIPRGKKQLSFLYPFFTGLIGSFTVLFAKSSTELVNSSLDGDNQFQYIPTYVIMVLTLVIGATQIHWLNRGLALYDQLIIIPTFNVCYSFFSIMGGGTFFNEFRDFNITEWIVFPSSVLLTFVGVYFICVPGAVVQENVAAAENYYETRRKISEDFGDAVKKVSRGLTRKISRGFTEGSESLLARGRIRTQSGEVARTQTLP